MFKNFFKEMPKGDKFIDYLVFLVIIAAIVAVWYFTNYFWGATALAFCVWSWRWYEDGAREVGIGKRSRAGFIRMFNSWPWFICFAFVAYLCCKRWAPEMFG